VGELNQAGKKLAGAPLLPRGMRRASKHWPCGETIQLAHPGNEILAKLVKLAGQSKLSLSLQNRYPCQGRWKCN
jgi:hypothetical protein